MTLRRFAFVTHRWIGLACSWVLAIVGGTGAVIVWPGWFPGRSLVSALHDSLAIGPIGRWMVLMATVAAIALQVGGLYLWWRRKILTVRLRAPWVRVSFELHHVVGVVGFILMLLLAVTGVGRALLIGADPIPESLVAWRELMIRYHAGREFNVGVKLLYSLASAGYAVQGVTGIVMWWREKGSGVS